MYIKNIDQSGINKHYSDLKPYIGRIISGKVLFYDNGKGLLRLFDGSILSATFIAENNLEKDKYVKFKIMEVKDNLVVLKALSSDNSKQNTKPSSPSQDIIKNLGIPLEDGNKIIQSLLKFGLPASDDNILKIYKNASSINKLKNLSHDNILSLLREHNIDDKYLNSFIDLISSFEDVDTDFLAFLLENDIPCDVHSIDKVQGYIRDPFFLNDINELIGKLIPEEHPSNSTFGIDHESSSLKGTRIFQGKNNQLIKEFIHIISQDDLKQLIDSLDILEHISNNYNTYYFNTKHDNVLYKQMLIIKNKNSKSFDINNIKLFLSVETEYTGLIDVFISKISTDISLLFKMEEKYVNAFKKNFYSLKNELLQKGYSRINLSANYTHTPVNIITLSSFFSDGKIRELDVKV